ncbi:DUF4199 domain-containing protein [Hymenobacter sp. B1770]|uniref:DUF4199 domain-containing protein n=1 Tax=Hymenobacter sp. B1770 TaxID=1718788 RepID=UPI003CFAB595
MAAATFDPNPTKTKPATGLVTKIGLRFGVGAGLVCAIWMVALQLTGNNGFGPKQIMAQLFVPLAAVTSEWVLRRRLKPERPGLGRSLGVGLLTVLVAALVSASSLVGIAQVAGEKAIAVNRAEILEIVHTQQRENSKVKLSEQELQQQLQKVEKITVGDMAVSNFIQLVLLGLTLALPGGIFLRE